MRKIERFVVLEGHRLRGGRIDWRYAYMIQGPRAAKAALRDGHRVFLVGDKGTLSSFRP